MHTKRTGRHHHAPYGQPPPQPSRYSGSVPPQHINVQPHSSAPLPLDAMPIDILAPHAHDMHMHAGYHHRPPNTREGAHHQDVHHDQRNNSSSSGARWAATATSNRIRQPIDRPPYDAFDGTGNYSNPPQRVPRSTEVHDHHHHHHRTFQDSAMQWRGAPTTTTTDLHNPHYQRPHYAAQPHNLVASHWHNPTAASGEYFEHQAQRHGSYHQPLFHGQQHQQDSRELHQQRHTHENIQEHFVSQAQQQRIMMPPHHGHCAGGGTYEQQAPAPPPMSLMPTSTPNTGAHQQLQHEVTGQSVPSPYAMNQHSYPSMACHDDRHPQTLMNSYSQSENREHSFHLSGYGPPSSLRSFGEGMPNTRDGSYLIEATGPRHPPHQPPQMVTTPSTSLSSSPPSQVLQYHYADPSPSIEGEEYSGGDKPAITTASPEVSNGKQLIVNYLSSQVTSAELHRMFSQFGLLDGARVIYDRETGMTRGFGFVYFRQRHCAAAALAALDGLEHDGKWLKITYSNNPLHLATVRRRAVNNSSTSRSSRHAKGVHVTAHLPPQASQHPPQ
ncbi:RNA-binding protein, putative [Bodo saltans]|uniref:RNA-binding protein, putative n=1 Tax=Bodo saltans TaxID=75058 RepID=A0A0S4IKC0_BODSA|nr:RNA-binding protein, putative [Bodo saltans]|eukprot:CUF05751.1 RNA-binding protein, putative [Bodo saltans]